MSNYLILNLDRDWHPDKEKDFKVGSIMKYLGQDYHIDKQCWTSGFELIGYPVQKDLPDIIRISN